MLSNRITEQKVEWEHLVFLPRTFRVTSSASLDRSHTRSTFDKTRLLVLCVLCVEHTVSLLGSQGHFDGSLCDDRPET